MLSNQQHQIIERTSNSKLAVLANKPTSYLTGIIATRNLRITTTEVNYREGSPWLKFLVKRIKAVRLGVDGKARSSDFTEESSHFINTIFTHIDVFLTYALRTTLQRQPWVITGRFNVSSPSDIDRENFTTWTIHTYVVLTLHFGGKLNQLS